MRVAARDFRGMARAEQVQYHKGDRDAQRPGKATRTLILNTATQLSSGLLGCLRKVRRYITFSYATTFSVLQRSAIIQSQI